MKLNDLLNVIEPLQEVKVYRVGDDGFCFQGVMAHTPRDLRLLNVESMHAYEWEIDILVS